MLPQNLTFSLYDTLISVSFSCFLYFRKIDTYVINFRRHRIVLDAAYIVTYSVVCVLVCICVSVGHVREPRKNS